jgi:hypothetical protein
MAIALRHVDVSPRVRYAWEDDSARSAEQQRVDPGFETPTAAEGERGSRPSAD